VKYLIDTDWVVDHLLGKPVAVQLLQTLEPDGIAISQVTFGEIYEGIYHGSNPTVAETVFLMFLANVDVLDLTAEIWKRYARIRGDLRKSGQLIAEFDNLIASTALEHDLILVTRNLKHYQRIPNLKLYQQSPNLI
jgi:predicted nucleic acid-binding protein